MGNRIVFRMVEASSEGVSPDRRKLVWTYGADIRRADHLSASGHLLPYHNERVSIKRVRELRIQIQNELRESGGTPDEYFFKEQQATRLHAKT